MIRRSEVPGLIGLAAVAITVGIISSLGAQPSQGAADFSQAMTAEVKNAQGQVVLSGKFVVSEEEDDDTERKATLAPTPIDPDASGEAEVEISGSGDRRRQEVEFSVRDVQPSGVFTFVIDGRVFATATADNRGRIEIERDVPLPSNQPR